MAKRRNSTASAERSHPATPAAVGTETAALLRLLPQYDPFRSPGGAWYDAARAEAAVSFIHDCIHHVEGSLAGKPFVLEPWQVSFISNLFGWVRKDAKGNTVRRYREALLYVCRKNGKTPLAAALALYVFFCDDEAGQQDYIAAADREQAGMLFRQAKGMVERCEGLSRACRIYGGNASAGQSRSIVREADSSFLRVVSADADTKHGGNSHLIIVDELHTQPTRELVDVLTTSMASANRKQPLIVYLTTADYDRPSICNEVRDRAVKARDAEPGGAGDDPAFLPAVWETTDKDDWTDPAVWARVNPNLGVSVSPEYLARECEKARANVAYENTFKRLHLNLRTGQVERVIAMPKWDACAALPLDIAALAGRDCFGGLDLASTTDLASFALAFTPGEDGIIPLLVRFWAPRERARERGRTDRVPYEDWSRAGWITLTDGDVIDYDVIRREINELARTYLIREVNADPWNATQIMTQLAGDGIKVQGFGQGFGTMTSPTKELLRLVTSCKLAPGANPVLRWQASNLATEKNSTEDVRPTKKKSGDRIDGVVALIMALGGLLVFTTSVYDGRGVLMLGAPEGPGHFPAGAPAGEPAAVAPVFAFGTDDDEDEDDLW